MFNINTYISRAQIFSLFSPVVFFPSVSSSSSSVLSPFLALLFCAFFPSHLLAENIEGILSKQILDFSDGSFETTYSLQKTDGKLLKLDLSDLSQDNLPVAGSLIKLEGELDKKTFYVKEIVGVVAKLNNNSALFQDSSFKVATILVNISGVSTGCSRPQVDFWLYSGPQSTRKHLEDSSRGRKSLESDTDGDGENDIFGPYTISSPATVCDPNDWAEKAEAAAIADGVNLNLYDIRVYVLPNFTDLNCGWSGFGTIDCLDDPSYICRAWISLCSDSRTYIHELGHAYGMQHASLDLDNDGIVTGSDEYSDHSCPMGNGPKVNMFNAPHQDQLNFFADFPSSVLITSAAGNYSLAPFESDPVSSAFPHIIKIPKPGGGFYYLSYRSETGIWGDFLSTYRNKVNIHTYVGAGSFNTRFVDSLDIGETFVDSSLNLEITVQSIDSNKATLLVDVPNSSNTDSDGDGIMDGQEITDGTNPQDRGSFLGRLGSPVHTLWNGFLDMVNIVEIINPSPSSRLQGTIDFFLQDGTLGHSQPFSVAPGNQYDVILNDIPSFTKDAYGVVRLTYTGLIDGRISYYRSAPGGNFEFAYSIPLEPESTGETAVGYNTFQPSQNPLDANNLVYNWLTVVNLSTSSQNFQVQTFDQTGLLIGTRSLSLPSFGRIDIDGGHQLAGASKVGFHKVIPNSNSAKYISQLMRFGSNAPLGGVATSFDFAFPLIAKIPNGEPQVLPISHNFAGNDWIEVINTKNSTTRVRLELHNFLGVKIHDQTVSLPAHSQFNLSTLDILADGDTGYALITPSQGESVVAQTMFYFRDSRSGSVRTIYGSQSREALGSKMFGSYNLFLNMENFLRVSNTSSNAISVNIEVSTTAGSLVRTWSFPPRTSIDIPLQTNFATTPDTYGFIQITSSNFSAVSAELLRKRSDATGVEFFFPTLLRP